MSIYTAALLVAMFVAMADGASERWESTELGPLFEVVLILKADGTYSHINQAGGCWLNWDDRGAWSVSEDGLLVLDSDNQIDWPTSSIASTLDESIGGVRIRLVDDAGCAVTHARIQLGDGSVAKLTDERGQAEFSPSEISDVVGRADWITFVSEFGSGFIRATAWTNCHTIRLGAARVHQRRRTHLMPRGSKLKQLDGLGITFDRCPDTR